MKPLFRKVNTTARGVHHQHGGDFRDARKTKVQKRENGRLQRVNPDLGIDDLYPACRCCTHTFNGAPFTRAYDPSRGLPM